MDRSLTSDHESIQGHFALMHPAPTGSQDNLGMPRNHQIDMPFKIGTLNTLQPIKMSFGCIRKIVTLVLATVILVYS